jgi:hypothetical protein
MSMKACRPRATANSFPVEARPTSAEHAATLAATFKIFRAGVDDAGV